MNTHYTTDRSTQMVLSVLKAYGIKKIVVSPGTTNMAFVASAQSDPCFEMYSSVDERSAAYIACGLSQESGEAVVIFCLRGIASVQGHQAYYFGCKHTLDSEWEDSHSHWFAPSFFSKRDRSY